MNATTDAVRRHYEPMISEADLEALVDHAFGAAEGFVTSAQLAGLDQFHTRGLAATAELGALLNVERGSEVLDAGSGLGGPARFLAETYGCQVTGVDLVPAYVRIATRLAARTRFDGGSVRYELGDLTSLPFPNQRFDAVVTQHVVMNIDNRLQAYREIRRVLKPAGRFAFYDVLSSDAKPGPIYPLPWAESDSSSVLLTEAETRTVLEQAGLVPEVWNDATAEALAWFAQRRPAVSDKPSLATVMGSRFVEMAANLARNLAEGRLRLVMARCLPR